MSEDASKQLDELIEALKDGKWGKIESMTLKIVFEEEVSEEDEQQT